MTIQTSIQKAKDWHPESEVPMTPTDRIRAQFFKGQSLNADEVAEDLGVSNALLGHAVSQMRLLGYSFEETNAEGRKRFYMTNPDHTPTEEQVEASRAPKRTKKTAKKKATTKRSAAIPVPEPMPVPVFGEFVEVYLLHANGDGKVHMGLRDEQTSWMVTIEAGAPRSAE